MAGKIVQSNPLLEAFGESLFLLPIEDFQMVTRNDWSIRKIKTERRIAGSQNTSVYTLLKKTDCMLLYRLSLLLALCLFVRCYC